MSKCRTSASLAVLYRLNSDRTGSGIWRLRATHAAWHVNVREVDKWQNTTSSSQLRQSVIYIDVLSFKCGRLISLLGACFQGANAPWMAEGAAVARGTRSMTPRRTVRVHAPGCWVQAPSSTVGDVGHEQGGASERMPRSLVIHPNYMLSPDTYPTISEPHRGERGSVEFNLVVHLISPITTVQPSSCVDPHLS